MIHFVKNGWQVLSHIRCSKRKQVCKNDFYSFELYACTVQ